MPETYRDASRSGFFPVEQREAAIQSKGINVCKRWINEGRVKDCMLEQQVQGDEEGGWEDQDLEVMEV